MKRICTFLLALILCFAAIPFSALAETPSDYVYIGLAKLTDGQYLASRSTTPTTAKPTGGYAYFKDGVVTLHNFTYIGKCQPVTHFYFEDDDGIEHYSQTSGVIFFPAEGKICVEGDNVLENTDVQPTDTATISRTLYRCGITTVGNLKIYGSGALNIYGYNGIASTTVFDEDSTFDDYIFDTLEITCAKFYCNVLMNGITVDGYQDECNVNINSEDFEIIAGDNGIVASNLYGKSYVTFLGGNSTIFALNGILTTEFYIDEPTAFCSVLVSDANLKVYTDGLGFYSNRLTVLGGDVFVDTHHYVASGNLTLSSNMEVAEGDFDGYYVWIAEKDRTTIDCDVNSDRNVDLFDYMTVKSICMGNTDFNSVTINKADVNGDDNVDMFDYLAVKNNYFNPPEVRASLNEKAFDVLCDYLQRKFSYSSSLNGYANKITVINSGEPKIEYVLKTDQNHSAIVLTATTTNDEGKAISAEVTLYKGALEAEVTATLSGTHNATATTMLGSFCSHSPNLLGFKCTSLNSSASAAFESDVEDLVYDLMSFFNSELVKTAPLSFSYLGFVNL